MKVALTGATGFIGSHVLTDLYKRGHEVTAPVRNDDQANIVAARGATPIVVNLNDRPAVRSVFGDADGAIHTASPGDATSADLDSAVVDAAIDAYAGTGKPYVHISGIWIYGANTSITEESPFQAPALVAWKEPIHRRVLGAKDLRGVVVVSGAAYGDGGGGIPGVLLGSPRDDQGNLIMLGTGQQHWPTVHAADLADFFRRVLEHEAAHDYYVIGNGLTPPSPSSLRPPPWQPARQGRYPAPTKRLETASATTSPKSCCSIRASSRPRLEPSSTGPPPTQDLSRNSATEVTATKARIRQHRRRWSCPGLGAFEPLRGPRRAPRESRSLVDRPDQLLNTAQGALVAGAIPDEPPPGEDSDGESERARRGYRADSRAGAAREQLC
jgi:nucleoside-diphosphate-sugar epimerase